MKSLKFENFLGLNYVEMTLNVYCLSAQKLPVNILFIFYFAFFWVLVESQGVHNNVSEYVSMLILSN